MSMQAKVAIDAENLVKVFNGSVRAVDGVSFQVHPGEVFGFLGPNGAGKTTTVSMLSAGLRPTSVRALIDGLEVGHDPEAVKRRIGVIFQESTADGDLTGRENIEVAAGCYGIASSVGRQRAEALIEQMQIADAADRPAKTYSGGMRRRLELAVGLVHEPRILFLDEPTLGLDPFARRQVWEVVRSAARKGSTLLLTTHYLDEAEQLSEELAVIESGRILYRGNAEALKSRVHREVRLRFEGPVSADELRSFGDVAVDRDGLTLLTTRARVGELTQLALERNSAMTVGPVTLEEAFLALVGKRIEEDTEETGP